MSSRTNGIASVHRSTTGAVDSWTKIGDEPKISSGNFAPAEILNELATTKSQSGSEWEPELHVSEFTDYDNCEALAVGAGRAKVFIALVMTDGTIYATRESSFIRVVPDFTANRRDGDSHWILKWDLAHTQPIEVLAALTS